MTRQALARAKKRTARKKKAEKARAKAVLKAIK